MTGRTHDLRSVAHALGGEVCGAQVLAPGPGHSAKDRSLSVCLSATAPDGFLTFSHSGDDFATCQDFARKRLGLHADGWKGIGRKGDDQKAASRPTVSDEGRTAAALRIWAETFDLRGTIAETYLASREIVAPLPAFLRFHMGLKHPSGQRWPAMVALVTDGESGKPVAIHRTFLARDGRGKAPVEPQKMMLGPTRGGAVRLSDAGVTLAIGEGLESCLSAMQATGIPTWAALSTSGLKTLSLPANVRDVILLADGDDAGERAAQQAARRWKDESRRVRIARPPRGMDFNDIARRAAAARDVA
jgi:putative DNA primase/helicase